MKITILAIGKFNNSVLGSSFKAIFETYVKRLKWSVELKELELKNSKNFSKQKLKEEEGVLILKALKPSSKLISLDEKAKQFSSVEFANMFEKFSLAGDSELTFVIGGAEGLSVEVLKKSALKISLGLMTYPHLMVRSILAEQIYRAFTIIEKHPYHRE